MYGDKSYKRMGILKEGLNLPILNKIFKGEILFVKSSYEENIEQKVDYWGVVDGEKRYAFDFKSSTKPRERFCLTYKIAGSNQNVFEVGNQSITSIFFLEHEKRFAFVPKKEIHKWFLENNPPVLPGRSDNSNYFEFPTEEILRLATYFKNY